jgi:hypothetical protein
MKQFETYTRFHLEDLKGIDHFGNLSVDGRIMLKVAKCEM